MQSSVPKKLVYGVFVLILQIGWIFPTPAIAGPSEDFEKLVGEMESAHDRYMELMDPPAAVPGQPGGAVAPMALADPRLPLLRKLEAAADANSSVDGAAKMQVQLLEWTMMVQPELTLKRFESIAAKFADAPDLQGFLMQLPVMFDADIGAPLGKPEPWLKGVADLVTNAKDRNQKLWALVTLGRLQMGMGRQSDAKISFQEVMKGSDDPDLTQIARGSIHEMERLQIGMLAPEFTTTSLDGREVTLKSQRGKIVLLNFWATW